MSVMVILILLTGSKIVLLCEECIFFSIQQTFIGDITFDSLDHLVHSPRYLALFTISLMHGS